MIRKTGGVPRLAEAVVAVEIHERAPGGDGRPKQGQRARVSLQGGGKGFRLAPDLVVGGRSGVNVIVRTMPEIGLVICVVGTLEL